MKHIAGLFALVAVVWTVQGFNTAQDVADRLNSLGPVAAASAKVVYDPEGETVTYCPPAGQAPCEIVNAKWLLFFPRHQAQ